MDYGFAPGNTGQEGRVRRVFQRRADTTLISATRNRRVVRDFINHLDSTAAIAKPIDNLILGSHANSQGFLFLPMNRGQSGPSKFETLEDTISTPARSINVPNTLIGYNTGDPLSNYIHIKGCNIGKATPFLEKLKEAAGGNLFVTAPLHFHGLFYHSHYGTWELMAYEFRLVRSAAFDTRDNYINELVGAGFTFYNGDTVTRADWEGWVPRRINRPSARTVSWPLGTTLGQRSTIPFSLSFRYVKRDYTFTISYPNPSQVPAPASRMTALSAALDNFKYRNTDLIGGFDSSHPYPEYERYGYSSKQAFIDGHTWRFSKSGRRLICKGRFHAYTLIIPITDRTPATTGNIIFNFYPKAGSAIPAVSTGLLESDTNFFAIV